MIVLGIETSCDETGIALYDSANGLLADLVYTQAAVHAEYGGVVPELASRDHIRKVIPLIRETTQQAGLTLQQLDGVAYTAGPGLVGALLVGATIGRSLAFALNIPSIGVHHMEGHLLAPMLEGQRPEFPFVALLISGGHTLLIEVSAIGKYKLLGESLDDAVGEAFDKTAKLLGLGYPGGPLISKLAEQGDHRRYTFPRPMVDRPGLDFSFSGLKTFTMNTFNNSERDDQVKADIACAFEDSIADTLVIKCKRAVKQTNLKCLVVAGGVSANRTIRSRLRKMAGAEKINVYFPKLEFCTDNGAMIAYAGCQRILAGEAESSQIKVQPRWSLEDI